MQGRSFEAASVLLLTALIATGVAVAATLSPLLALGATAALLVLGLVVLNAQVVLLALVAAFPWDDALGFPTQTVSVVKLLGALALIAFLYRAVTRPEPLRLPGTLASVSVFISVVLLSVLTSPAPQDSIAKALRYVSFAIFFFVFIQLVRSPAQIRRAVRVLVMSTAAAAVAGLVLFLQGHRRLAGGPVGDPNDFAFLLMTMLPLAVYLTAVDRGRRWFWGVCCLLMLAAVLGTLSRGALVGAAALLLWALGTRRLPVTRVLAAIGVALGVLVLGLTLWRPLIDERLQAKSRIAHTNIESRQALWLAAIRMAGDRPVTGVGPGRFGTESPQYLVNEPLGLENPVVHNSYLEILAECGLGALAAFVVFLAGTWRLARRAQARGVRDGDHDARRLALAVQASLVVGMASACFLSVQIAAPFWLLGGLAVVVNASFAEQPMSVRAGPRVAPAV